MAPAKKIGHPATCDKTEKDTPLMTTNRHKSPRTIINFPLPPILAEAHNDMLTAPTHTIPVRLFELHDGDDTIHDSDSDSVAEDVSTTIHPALVADSGGGIDRYSDTMAQIHMFVSYER